VTGGQEPPRADAIAAARSVRDRLLGWLTRDAVPLWSTRGLDQNSGAFVECLDAAGPAPLVPRRARVQPRQVYAFARAAEYGIPELELVALRGLDTFIECYGRPDGLFRTLVSANGAPLDDSVHLYDQAFALLGMAAGQRIAAVWEPRALDLLAALRRHLGRPQGGFASGQGPESALESNAHMHLLEAALEWCGQSSEPVWSELADELASLALQRFVDPESGVIREHFDREWRPLAETSGRSVEPGHQFEWAWLLMRWQRPRDARPSATALRLIEIGESAGVRGDVAVDALRDDLSICDARARLWPQTERIKAGALAASLTGESGHWLAATAAANALERYLATGTPGLWHDRLDAAGDFLIGPAPAGNLYHLVGAILALDAAVNEAAAVSEAGATVSEARTGRAEQADP
jgi:mannose-6-phosphate isomerase